MKIYIQGLDDRQESKDLSSRLAEAVSKEHEVINLNNDLETDLYKAEQADALITSLACDDKTWTLIGLATAARMPIIPFWNASYPYPDPFSAKPEKVYGFIRHTHLQNRHLIRKNTDKRHWPSTNITDLIEDLKILEQNKKWRKARIQKPGKETVNLSLPVYIVGDSRTKDDARAFYDIAKGFEQSGIEYFIPPIELDGGYSPDEFPKLIDMSVGLTQDCFELSSTKSSFIVSRIDKRNLMGARWEEGVAWFHSKPILYLYRYIFPSRFPYEKYLQRKPAGLYYDSVFKQNEELWKIRVHAARTEEELAGVIIRARNTQKQEKCHTYI